jgi:hypothetical protein
VHVECAISLSPGSRYSSIEVCFYCPVLHADLCKLELPQAPRRSSPFVGSIHEPHLSSAAKHSTPPAYLHSTPALTASAFSIRLLFNSRERSLLLPLHTNTSRPEQQPVLATNATYLHAPAAVPGRVVPGSPPAAAPPCRPTRSAPGTTGASASPGASPGSRRCSRGGSATALQSHRGQQWHHSASQQHDRSSRARQRHSSEHGYWHDGREQACSRLDRTAHEADDTRISPPGAEQEAGTSARAGLDTLAFFRCVKRHLGYVEIANVGRRHGFAPPRDHLRIPAA